MTAFGNGPTFRFIVTPNVWTVAGVGGFDGRDGDPFAATFPDPLPANVEVGYSRALGPDPVRFSITRPTVGGVDLQYARLGLTWTPAGGVRTQAHCVIGSPTAPADLFSARSGEFGRTVMIATAYVRDGAAVRAYALGRSAAALAVDSAARRVTFSVRLTGTPIGFAAADRDLGTLTATASIDPDSGTVLAALAADRAVTGTVSGRLFGPAAVEVALALNASLPATGAAPEMTLAGAVFGSR